MNWRSEIMNFTLALIYPAPSDQGFKNISVSELVCVVSADQTCSSSFFSNLLRFIDSGAQLHAFPVIACAIYQCNCAVFIACMSCKQRRCHALWHRRVRRLPALVPVI